MHSEYLIARIRTSLAYFIYSFLQLSISIGLLVYVAIDPWKNLMNQNVINVEILLTFSIFIDIFLKVINQYYSYFKSIWNLIDIISFIFISIFIAIFIYLRNYNMDDAKTDDLIGLFVISLRCLMQTIRIIVSLRQSLEVNQIQKSTNDICFYRKQPPSRTLHYPKRNFHDQSLLDVSAEVSLEQDLLYIEKIRQMMIPYTYSYDNQTLNQTSSTRNQTNNSINNLSNFLKNTHKRWKANETFDEIDEENLALLD